MLKAYFKIALRNILKHFFYTSVNVFGLFAGIVFAMLIGVYVIQELQVNKKLRNAKLQYFLQSNWKNNQGNEITTLAPLAKRLKEDYPNLVANYYRWDGITSGVTKGNKSFREGIQLGDSTLLTMYGFELLHGDANSALTAPYSVVITESSALKYFGKTNVIGQTLSIQNFSGNKRDFAITGVLKNTPENSVINLNDENNNSLFIPTNTYSFFGRTSLDDWNNIWIPSYIQLKEGANIESINKAITQLVKTNTSNQVKENLKVEVIPLQEYYLHKNNSLVKRMLYTISFIGIFILLMAVVNFINITLGSSASRIKEIGVRKLMGSIRSHLVIQFLAESVIIVTLATVLALAAYPFLKPIFASVVGKDLPDLTSFPLYFIFVLAVLVLLVGLLAGLYPAIVFSSLKTSDSIKGKMKSVGEKIWLRKFLVGFQFCIALIVLIAATISTMQVNHFFSKNIGYDKEFIIASQAPRDWSLAGVQKMKSIRNQFAAMPQVQEVSLSYEIPNGNNGGIAPVYKTENDSSRAISMQLLITDDNYLKTYGIELKAGDFFGNLEQDSGKVVLNEKAVTLLGYKNPSDAIGRQVRIHQDSTVYTIKGVIKDFQFFSMEDPMKPMLLFDVYSLRIYRYLSFKLKPGNLPSALDQIQKKWATLMPESSFEYVFINDILKKIYRTEIQMKRAAFTATCISLTIALLGVLGLVSLSIHKRVKEIGIRKVLGASVQSIMLLFLKEFVYIIIFAGLIACPIAYWLMNNWLNNYANHINVSPLVMIGAVGIIALSMVILVCLQSALTTMEKPVKSLRSE